MIDEYKKELAIVQKKLRVIDKLSNTLAPESELTQKQREECAYLIHKIIEAPEVSSDLQREVTWFQIESNRSLFIKQ